MKNYLCLNGKKTELTEEQLMQLGIVKKPIATLSKDGKTAKIGEYEFIVLKKNCDTVELLLKDKIDDLQFDSDCNNFAESDIKKYLDEFADKIAEIVGEENIVEHTVDLTSLDGLKDFGVCECRASLLTYDQVKENIELLDDFKIDTWWWTSTPWSTKKHGIDYSVVCVSSGGNIDYDYCDYRDGGVRPFCILKSNIFVSK